MPHPIMESSSFKIVVLDQTFHFEYKGIPSVASRRVVDCLAGNGWLVFCGLGGHFFSSKPPFLLT